MDYAQLAVVCCALMRGGVLCYIVSCIYCDCCIILWRFSHAVMIAISCNMLQKPCCKP